MKNRLNIIYYIPGVLTLAIAPILVTVTLSKYIADRKEHCIYIIDESKEGTHIIHNFPNKNHQTVELTGSNVNDSLKIILIENFARGLHLSKNDSIGLKVVIGNKIKYKTYIELLNSCLKSGISDWVPSRNIVYIFQNNNPEYNHKNCQNALMPEYIEIVSDQEIKAKSEISLIQKIRKEKKKILFAFPFTILIAFFGYQMIRNLKNVC